MPPSIGYTLPADPVEFSLEDAMLNTWVEDTSVYLRLDSSDVASPDELPSDQS